MLKVNNKNTSVLEGRQWRHSRVFIVKFEHISHFFSSVFIGVFNKEVLAGEFVFTH